MKWCPQCNGYGFSLKERSRRGTQCGGSGLVWAGGERPVAGRNSEPSERCLANGGFEVSGSPGYPTPPTRPELEAAHNRGLKQTFICGGVEDPDRIVEHDTPDSVDLATFRIPYRRASPPRTTNSPAFERRTENSGATSKKYGCPVG